MTWPFIGRYLLTPEIFDMLDKQKAGAGGEIQLTDAIDALNKTQRVFAHEFKGQRFDVGNKEGYMETSIQYGLRHPETKDALRKYIMTWARSWKAKARRSQPASEIRKERSCLKTRQLLFSTLFCYLQMILPSAGRIWTP